MSIKLYDIDEQIFLLLKRKDYSIGYQNRILTISLKDYNNENLSRLLQIICYNIQYEIQININENYNYDIYNSFGKDNDVIIPFFRSRNLTTTKQIFYSSFSKNIAYNFNYDYVNLEKIIPYGKILYLVLKDEDNFYSVPVSKSTDIFNCWNLGIEYLKQIYNTDNLININQIQRTILSGMLDQDISRFNYLMFEDAQEDEIFMKYKNCFDQVDYIFRDLEIVKRKIKPVFEVEKLNKTIIPYNYLSLYNYKNLILYDSNNISFVKKELNLEISDYEVLDYIFEKLKKINHYRFIKYNLPSILKTNDEDYIKSKLIEEFSDSRYYLENYKKTYKKKFTITRLYENLFEVTVYRTNLTKVVKLNEEEIPNFIKLDSFLDFDENFYFLRIEHNNLFIEYDLLDELFI